MVRGSVVTARRARGRVTLHCSLSSEGICVLDRSLECLMKANDMRRDDRWTLGVQ
jgi:hypothetical protein